MVLPSHATVPTHHLGLMSGFMGAHTTQSPPGAGILGTRRLCVASARACTLHRGAAVAQGPERGAFYLRAGLKYGRGHFSRRPVFIRILGIQSFSPTADRASHQPQRARRPALLEEVHGAEEANVWTHTRPHQEVYTDIQPRSRPLCLLKQR